MPFLLIGCAVGPDFKSPPSPKVNDYTEGASPSQTTTAPIAGGNIQTFIKNGNIDSKWWTLFKNDKLNALIEKGLKNNPSVSKAIATLQEARENANATFGADLIPAITGSLSSTRQRANGSTFGSSNTSFLNNLYGANIGVSYTLDIFGENRRNWEAMLSAVELEYFNLQTAYLTVAANIAIAAITEASLREQISATNTLIQLQSDTLDIMKKQFELGGVSEVDVLNQTTQLEQTRASLPSLEKSLYQTRHSLAILVGGLPHNEKLPTFDIRNFTLPDQIPVSLPSNFVRQRPDLRAAEASLHGACAKVGIATANLFPSLTLSGSYGSSANSKDTFLKGPGYVWDIGMKLLQPIFNGWSLIAQKDAAIASYKQALATYQDTLLTAFQDVANALRSLETDAQALKIQVAAEQASKKALDVAMQQYKLGSITFISLLNTQQQYQEALINRIKAQASRYTDTITLFQALGGGWWNEPKTQFNEAQK